MKKFFLIVFILSFYACADIKETTLSKETPLSLETHNLVFEQLADTWDEAIPLGNGMVGNLVWQKDKKLRFSLDRADLWDLRPMENLDFDQWKFQDVYAYWKEDQYEAVQQVFDVPYDTLPAPSKIPGGALTFAIEALGAVKSVVLDIQTATCIIEWEKGTKLTTFIHAQRPVGWYQFENIPESLENLSLELVPPSYQSKGDRANMGQSRGDLDQLGYKLGAVEKNGNAYTYQQEGWDGFSYQVATRWERKGNTLTGCWSISSAKEGGPAAPKASEVVADEIKERYTSAFREHAGWWKGYWQRSGVNIPDTVLEKQYYLGMYKFGAVARPTTPPISLQSVWTADNGKLPPWKGDFHHDLNTQLSYWPAYTGNHLKLGEGFLNWLWEHRPVFKRYTRDYFGVEGLNVPGVTTLEGAPMGGWAQYAMGPTVSAWLGHHFYLHWQYSRDRDFLEQRAYPWIREAAIFFDEIAVKTANGQRKLPLSASPEIYNNTRHAWFDQTTNFDLGLIRWTYTAASELALELGEKEEAEKWDRILSGWPGLAVDRKTGLMIAPGFPYDESHRHFSHLMAYHPLGLVDFPEDAAVINNTLANLEARGTLAWTGYSFSWLGNLYARAGRGEDAARVLRIFAQCFTLKNSFHVNGDQCKAGHSNFTYRPFTLEGNFAFAAAVQEMLLQSHTGVVKIFPAIPGEWDDAGFDQLRARGAFLVSAQRENGLVKQVEIVAEKKGKLILQDPFDNREFTASKSYTREGGNLLIEMKAGERVKLEGL